MGKFAITAFSPLGPEIVQNRRTNVHGCYVSSSETLLTDAEDLGDAFSIAPAVVSGFTAP